MSDHSAVSRFFSIPELRITLSAQIAQKADLSKFARVDRLSHLLVTPLLFADIDVRLKDILAIAQAFRSRPDLTYRCMVLRVRSPDYEDVRCNEAERKKLFGMKCDELAFVLRAMSSYGRLSTFEWLWEPGWLDDDQVPLPVWESLRLNAHSLQKVDVALSKADGESWCAFASNQYSRLQSFRVDLSKARGWGCPTFRDMLNNAQELHSLNLTLPSCYGPQDLALSSTHHGLRSFTFQGSILTGLSKEDEPLTKDFLKRHPTLEYLDLCCQTKFDIDDEDLLQLRAISVEHTTLNAVPNLFSETVERPVKALRLVHMPHLTMTTVFGLCASVASTLKYLHMDSSIFSFRTNLPHFPALLGTLPALVELRLGAESVCAIQLQHRLCEQDLTDFLKVLPRGCSPSLTAISFADSRGKSLSERTLDNLPRVPPMLTHLSWDVMGTRHLYRIVERSDNKSRAVCAGKSPSPKSRLWVQESLVDHFGSEADRW